MNILIIIIITTVFFLCSEASDIIARFGDCGGVIMSSRYVLTAAQCVHRDYINIRVSIQDSVYGIEDVKFHPGFNEMRRNDDIALIKLDRDIKPLDRVKFANISSSIFTSQKDTVYITDGKPIKQTVKVNTTLCLLDSIICTVGQENIISGFPLVIDDESNIPNVIGISSFYYKNSNIFSRVSYYHDWIIKIITDQEDDLMENIKDLMENIKTFILKEEEDFLNDSLYALLDFVVISFFPFLGIVIGFTLCIFLLLTCPMFKNKNIHSAVPKSTVPKSTVPKSTVPKSTVPKSTVEGNECQNITHPYNTRLSAKKLQRK